MPDKVNYPVSIIVPSYNGKAKVSRLLADLTKQSFKLFETIVVIDGSTDGTRQELDSQKFDLASLKIIEQKNAGRAGARNTGADAASSDILLFIDDDMILSENFVEEHLKVHSQHDIVIGKLEAYDDGINQEIFEFSYYMNNKANAVLFSTSRQEFETPYITAGNFSIKKHLFEVIGRFDSRLNDSEDFELAVRCKENGHRIHYSAECLLYHPLPSTFCESNRAKEYRLGRTELLKYHPSIEKYLKTHQNTIKAYKRPFFYLFSFKIWLILADKKVFRILPKPLRFKFYDILGTANFHY